jgi:hypothetical protein
MKRKKDKKILHIGTQKEKPSKGENVPTGWTTRKGTSHMCSTKKMIAPD